MKKLDDIPKKNIYKVPDGYFEKLPGIIQSRIAEKEESRGWSWSWSLSLKLALPVAIIAVAGIFWFRSTDTAVDIPYELAQIAPEQLEQYLTMHDALYDSDLSTDEIVESGEWNKADVQQLEDSVYSEYQATHQQIQKALDQLDNEL